MNGVVLPLGGAVKELETIGTAQGNLVALLPAQGYRLVLLLQPNTQILYTIRKMTHSQSGVYTFITYFITSSGRGGGFMTKKTLVYVNDGGRGGFHFQ